MTVAVLKGIQSVLNYLIGAAIDLNSAACRRQSGKQQTANINFVRAVNAAETRKANKISKSKAAVTKLNDQLGELYDI